MEFDEIGAKVKKTFDKKGVLILGGVVAGLFLIMYLVQSKNDDDVVRIQTGYGEYPESEANSDVIISTLEEDMNSYTNEMLEAIGGMFDNTNNKLEDMSQATNDYINEGFESMKDKADIDYSDNVSKDDIAGVGSDITTPNNPVSGSVNEMPPLLSPSQEGAKSMSTNKWFGQPPDGAYVIDGLTNETKLLTPDEYQKRVLGTSGSVAVVDDRPHEVYKGDAETGKWELVNPAYTTAKDAAFKDAAQRHLDSMLKRLPSSNNVIEGSSTAIGKGVKA